MVSLVYRLYIVYALERTTNAEPFKNWLWKCLVIKRSPVLGVRYSNLQLSWVLRLWHFLTFYSQFRTQDPCQLLLAIWNKYKNIINTRIHIAVGIWKASKSCIPIVQVCPIVVLYVCLMNIRLRGKCISDYFLNVLFADWFSSSQSSDNEFQCPIKCTRQILQNLANKLKLRQWVFTYLLGDLQY